MNCVPQLRSSQHSPAVTVILPHYRCDGFVAEAVASVLSQTFSDLELWVIDDASPSEAWAAAIDCFRTDPRLKVMRTSRNVGPYRIKSRLISDCRSPFIAFQDADDRSHPERIAAQLRFLAKHDVGIVGTSFRYINAAGQYVRRKKMPRYGNLAQRCGRKFLALHPTTIVRRAVFDRIGAFDASTRIAADADFFLRAAWRCWIGNIRVPLYDYRLHVNSLTCTPCTGFASQERLNYVDAMMKRERDRRRRHIVTDDALQPPASDIDFEIFTDRQRSAMGRCRALLSVHNF